MTASPVPSPNGRSHGAIAPHRNGRLRRFLADGRAASIVEFGLVTPIFLATLGAAIDFGMAVRTKFQLANALAAASNYTLANANSVSSSGASSLASTLSSIISSSYPTANWAGASVNVNNGATATAAGGCSMTPTGVTATNADYYYCPTGSGVSVTWGTGYTVTPPASPPSCGSNGTVAGKFVVLQACRSFNSMILPSGIIPSSITASSVIQVQ